MTPKTANAMMAAPPAPQLYPGLAEPHPKMPDAPNFSGVESQSEKLPRNAVAVPGPCAVFRGSFDPNRRGDKHGHLLLYSSSDTGASWSERMRSFLTDEWDDIHMYKSAFLEMTAVMLLCYTSGMLDISFGTFGGPYTPNWVGITNIILTSLFIIGTAAGSGGHINPLITFGTFCTGLTGFSRAICYMIGQTLGGAIAGGLVRGTIGKARLDGSFNGGGCFFVHDAVDTVTVGQAFLIEMMSCFTLLYLAFGCALDPRTGQQTGPLLGPFLVACALGLISFGTAGISPGFAGSSMNPARCFAFGVSRGNFQDQWIWWVAPFAGALLCTVVYRTAPPYHAKLAGQVLSDRTHGHLPPRLPKEQEQPANGPS